MKDYTTQRDEATGKTYRHYGTAPGPFLTVEIKHPMKSPERIKDFIDGAPSPEPPQDFTVRLERGTEWIWYRGGWWTLETLPALAQGMFHAKEYERDHASMSIPRE